MAERLERDPSAVTEIAQGGWGYKRELGILITKNVDTCIGVSIYSPDDRQGWLGHFDMPTLRGEDNILDLMLDSAATSISNPTHTRLWVGGGALVQPGSYIPYNKPEELREILNIETLRLRELVIAALTKRFTHYVLDISWLEKLGPIDYSLDVSTGQETISSSISP